MNGMSKTIFLIVSIIALLYSGLCFALSIEHFWFTTGNPVDFYLFLPLDGQLGIDLTEKAPEFLANIMNLYKDFLEQIVGFTYMDSMTKEIELILIIVGFLLSVLGFFTKPSMDVEGRTNPAQYLWTHRPNAFRRCLAMPWGLIVGAWCKNKALVIIPIILLPFYAPWSIMMTIFLIIPFSLMKAIIGSKIKSAAKKESASYQRNTDHGVCPHCKRNFDRPSVKCRCGLILEYPVPSIYGYKYHTCNKGHNIPCESGKRAELTTICPHCNKEIETREALPITISFVGSLNSGKTSLMLAAVEAITQNARLVDVTVDSPSPGLSKDAISAKNYAPHTIPGELESQIIFLRSMKLQDREIVFNDISGAEFQPDINKVIFEEYYNYTNGIIFTFDPMSFNRGIKKDTPQEVFDSFHYMFTTVRRMSPSTVSDIPFAIVATKNDVSKPKLNDDDVRQFLIDNGEENFIKIVESLFSDIKYFSTCAHGDESASSMRPVWWIVEHTDKELTKTVRLPDI